MHKIGISFQSRDTADDVRENFVRPLQQAIAADNSGFYSNYLRQVDPEGVDETEHLLVFEVHDFKDGLRILRTCLQTLKLPAEVHLHNLDPSDPMY